MNSILNFSCKVITPMFSGNAFQKAELRPPEIKSSLRFWWRAFHPELVMGNYERMQKLESKIFGGHFKDKKNGHESQEVSEKSKIDILSFSSEILPVENSVMVPHKNLKNSAIKPRTEFTISFLVPDIIYEDKENSKPLFTSVQFKALFILISVLGGIGRRGRKGNGSYCTTQIDGKDYSISALNEIYEQIKILNPDGYQFDKNKIIKAPFVTPPPEYPFVKEIRISTKLDNAENLREKIDRSFHDLHARKPIIVNGNSTQLTEEMYKNNLGSANPRFASPIILSIIPVSDKFTIISTLLNTAPSRHYNLAIQEAVINKILG